MSCVNSRCRKTVLRTTKIAVQAVQYGPSLENYFLGFQYEILMTWLSNHKIKYHEVTSIILRLVIFSSSIITLIIIENCRGKTCSKCKNETSISLFISWIERGIENQRYFTTIETMNRIHRHLWRQLKTNLELKAKIINKWIKYITRNESAVSVKTKLV